MSKLKTGLGVAAAAALVLAAATPASAQHWGHHHRGPGIAGAVVGGIVGTAIAAGAANSYYNDGYGYGPGYRDSYAYYGDSSEFGGPNYYGPRSYNRYGSSPGSIEGPGGYNVPSRY